MLFSTISHIFPNRYLLLINSQIKRKWRLYKTEAINAPDRPFNPGLFVGESPNIDFWDDSINALVDLGWDSPTIHVPFSFKSFFFESAQEIGIGFLTPVLNCQKKRFIPVVCRMKVWAFDLLDQMQGRGGVYSCPVVENNSDQESDHNKQKKFMCWWYSKRSSC